MAKRYYWLKLQEDFFSSPRIKKLRRIAGGDTFTIVYLKMQLLSVKSGGILTFQGIEETFEDELSLVLDEDAENVRVTVAYLISQGLMEQSDNKNFLLPQAAENIGSESESKQRVREFRKRQSIRESIPLVMVKKLSSEMIALPDGSTKYIDNKRYGGNAEYVYELAECKCEICGETNSKKLLIHHNNGYSNDLEDLYLLCKSCHGLVESGAIKCEMHRRKSVTCNACVTGCNTDIDKDKDKDGDREGDKEGDKEEKSPLAAVMTAYMDNINPTPSPICIDELKGYVDQMGAECCLRAINIALDEKKTGWSYIRAILRNKLSQGVRCIADWDALDMKREGGKNSGTDTGDPSGQKTWNGYEIHSVLDD